MRAFDLVDCVSLNAGKTSITKLALLGDSWTDATWYAVPPGSYYKVPNPKNHWSVTISQEMGINVVNHGLAGDLAASVAANNNSRMTHVINDRPSHVMIMLGGNDIYNSYTPDQIVASINTIASTMVSNGIKPFYGWYPISPGGSTPPLETQWARIVEMRTRLQQVATANSTILVDFFNTAMYNGVDGVNRAYYLPDGIHANSAGMPIIANYLMSLINNKNM